MAREIELLLKTKLDASDAPTQAEQLGGQIADSLTRALEQGLDKFATMFADKIGQATQGMAGQMPAGMLPGAIGPDSPPAGTPASQATMLQGQQNTQMQQQAEIITQLRSQLNNQQAAGNAAPPGIGSFQSPFVTAPPSSLTRTVAGAYPSFNAVPGEILAKGGQRSSLEAVSAEGTLRQFSMARQIERSGGGAVDPELVNRAKQATPVIQNQMREKERETANLVNKLSELNKTIISLNALQEKTQARMQAGQITDKQGQDLLERIQNKRTSQEHASTQMQGGIISGERITRQMGDLIKSQQAADREAEAMEAEVAMRRHAMGAGAIGAAVTGANFLSRLPVTMARRAAGERGLDEMVERAAMEGDINKMIAIQELGGAEELKRQSLTQAKMQAGGGIALGLGGAGLAALLAMGPGGWTVGLGMAAVGGLGVAGMGVDKLITAPEEAARISQQRISLHMSQEQMAMKSRQLSYGALTRSRTSALGMGAPELEGMLLGQAGERTAAVNLGLTNQMFEAQQKDLASGFGGIFFDPRVGRMSYQRSGAEQMLGLSPMSKAGTNFTTGIADDAEMTRMASQMQAAGFGNFAQVSASMFRAGGTGGGAGEAKLRMRELRDMYTEAVALGMDKTKMPALMADMAKRAENRGLGGGDLEAGIMRRVMAIVASTGGGDPSQMQKITQSVTSTIQEIQGRREGGTGLDLVAETNAITEAVGGTAIGKKMNMSDVQLLKGQVQGVNDRADRENVQATLESVGITASPEEFDELMGKLKTVPGSYMKKRLALEGQTGTGERSRAAMLAYKTGMTGKELLQRVKTYKAYELMGDGGNMADVMQMMTPEGSIGQGSEDGRRYFEMEGGKRKYLDELMGSADTRGKDAITFSETGTAAGIEKGLTLFSSSVNRLKTDLDSLAAKIRSITAGGTVYKISEEGEASADAMMSSGMASGMTGGLGLGGFSKSLFPKQAKPPKIGSSSDDGETK